MENNVRFDVIKLDDGFFIKFEENNFEFIANILDSEIENKNILDIMQIVDKNLSGLGALIPNHEDGQIFETAEIQQKKYRAELCALIADQIMVEMKNEQENG